jgi:hypothetical protein
MAKKPTSIPMEHQPVHGERDLATPMAPAPSKRTSKASRLRVPPRQADTSRRDSLRKQRSQMEAVKKQRGSTSKKARQPQGV